MVKLHPFLTLAEIDVSGQLDAPLYTELERRWTLEPVRVMWRGSPYCPCYTADVKLLRFAVAGEDDYVSHARPRAHQSMYSLSLQTRLSFYFRFADMYSVPRITQTVGTDSETP